MIAVYLNKYEDLNHILFDLTFNEEEVVILRLGGVQFDIGFTEQDMIDRATEIFNGNFQDYILTEIIIN